MNNADFNYALFDLDGTLTDPSLGITNSIMYALSKMGRKIPPREELYKFIGPPLVPSFSEFLGMTADEALTALKFYREYFSTKGLFENIPYDGIDGTLASIKNHGITLALATSKPEDFAVQILEHFGLAEYFTKICGATMDERRTKKAEVVEYALESLGICSADKSSVIMVGDRLHDIEGARENNIKSVGVTWGFGSEDELKKAGADYIAHNMDELISLIKKED